MRALSRAMIYVSVPANPKATRIMYQNHYGWFQRIENGLYGLTDKGRDAINKYSSVIEELPDLMELPKKEA